MVVANCTIPGCNFATADISEAMAIALLNNHGYAHTTAAPGPLPARGPSLERPQVNVGISNEEWNVFIRRWEVFRLGSGIDNASAPSQLFQCCGTELGDSILKSNPNATTGTLAELLNEMRSLAVIPIATGVLRTELLQMRQDRDEQFRAYAARVRGKAETCNFITSCTCGRDVNYTDHTIRDALIGGIYDHDIRREVLGTANILQVPVNDVIAIVENKEMARNALPSPNLSAVSSFMRQRNSPPVNSPTNIAPPDKNKRGTCPDCKKSFSIYTEGPKGWNLKPHTQCIDCFRIRRRNRRQQPKNENVVSTIESNSISQISIVSVSSQQSLSQITSSPARSKALDHHIFNKGTWKKAPLRDHPRIPILISVAESSSNYQHKYDYQANIVAVADTGAQSNMLPLSEFRACGFPLDILFPVTLDFSAANTSFISVEGAFFAKIATNFTGQSNTSCNSMIYVSKSVKSMFLSQDTLISLGIVPKDFPSTSYVQPEISARGGVTPKMSVNAIRTFTDGCHKISTRSDTTCSCLQRSVVPQRPPQLPFPCTPENNLRMKTWLLERYQSSTFNTCSHRPLPCMEGPPVDIHVDAAATPKACHTPASIPLHWQQRVHEDLLRDESLGVIERVPYGEPVTWCHRMVVTRKHDGNPRRTVDLSPLNKYCKRETFAAESPFQLARRIPKNTWKTVTDAWNGYHSVPLRRSDRHLTTFITPFGRWRYTRAPQGFVSSGDGYNRRFDAILSSFDRKERCVDDTIHFDTDLEQHWWRTIDFLTLVGQAGIVLNPDKFQFAEKTVDFAGFRVSNSTIEPLPKYMDAINDFPTPVSTTDIRSWFGLVNQVTNYAQLRDTMAPFKPFLSPRHKFEWNGELDRAFKESKKAIIEAIRQGVEIFDIQKRTCLRPDWSNKGIGYFLMQQWCTCESGLPGCCDGGWKITLAGSRFLTTAEERYAAVEGEALAVAWGLEQTKYFTLGCDNLVVVTDHKPLVKLLGDRTLDEISNTRLFRLKQRTLPWRFEIRHLPGKSNLAADATSRNPSSSGSVDSVALHDNQVIDVLEDAIMASIGAEVKDTFTIPWSLVARETASDASLSRLMKLIEHGFQDHDKGDVTVASLWHMKDALYIHHGVILYQDRVLVPHTLRQTVLKHLHSAHQGISAMEKRARAIVYWPGMTADIQSTRESCLQCNRNAPSQAATPPLAERTPSTPFESVFADFFDYGGYHYLVVGDRLSGWVEIYKSSSGTHTSGAAGLIMHLRRLFTTFGVPEELSSDGGPEFTAGSTADFLKRWGINHRISSAYFAQSNGRAEVAVKKAKRLLMSNTGPAGTLDTDSFLRAMLQLRNTPDPDCNISPAQIIFGRPISDAFSFVNRLEKYSNPHVQPIWRDAWAAKEYALRARMTRTTEALGAHSRPLRPLTLGELVFLQNQTGPNANKWDRTGKVVEILENDQYWVKVDGSGRLTRRNRRFLRAYTPTKTSVGDTSRSVTLPVLSSPTEFPITSTGKYDADDPTTSRDTIADPEGPQDTGDNHSPPFAPPDDNGVTMDIPSEPTESTRPRRTIRHPPRYEPESGRWITG